MRHWRWGNKIVLYTDKHGNVELRADIEKDTIWATQEQIGDIFDVQKAVVSKHLKNIYNSNELTKDSTVSILETVQIEGGRAIRRKIAYYDLDAVIAVGYRVNSKKATQFRIWATRILRQFLIKGFNLDQRKLSVSTDNLKDLKEAIAFMESESLGGRLKARMTVRMSKNLLP